MGVPSNTNGIGQTQNGYNLKFGNKKHIVTLKNDNGVNRSAFDNVNAQRGRYCDNYSAYTNAIFAKYDTDHNNILDNTELTAFYQGIRDAAGSNDNLKEREARNFFRDNLGMNDATKADSRNFLQTFLGAIGGNNDVITSATKNAEDGSVLVNYNPNYGNSAGISNLTEKYTMVNGKSVLTEDRYTDISDNAVVAHEYNTETTNDDTDFINKYVTQDYNTFMGQNGDNLIKSDSLPSGINNVTHQYGSDGETLQKIEFLDNTDNALCTRTYTYNDGNTVITQTGADGKTQAEYTINANNQLTEEKVYTDGTQTATKTYLNDANNTIMTTDMNNKTTNIAHGNFGVQLDHNEAGQVISHARAGESFDQTAARLGFDKVDNPEGYQAFVDANKHARGGAGKGGWFRLNQDVIIPQNRLSDLNIANYKVDPAVEKQVFKDSDVDLTPGADNTAAINKQRERNNALNTTNHIVEEFVNADKSELNIVTNNETGNIYCNYNGHTIMLKTDSDGSHHISISDGTNCTSYTAINVNFQPELSNSELMRHTGDSMTQAANNDYNTALCQTLFNLAGGIWPDIPTAEA